MLLSLAAIEEIAHKLCSVIHRSKLSVGPACGLPAVVHWLGPDMHRRSSGLSTDAYRRLRCSSVDIRVQITLKTIDGISANWLTNTWALTNSVDPTEADFNEYTQCFRSFYVACTSIQALPLNSVGHIAKYIDLDETVKPIYPVYEETWSLPAVSSNAQLPSEVAMCLSYQCERQSGVPQASRRGRVYIGPIASATMDQGRPSAAARTTLVNAGKALYDDLLACTTPAALTVWSNKLRQTGAIAEFWVDNAYDTQRRRGPKPTLRTTVTV